MYYYSSRRRLRFLVKGKKLDRGTLIHAIAAHHYREVGLNLNRDPKKSKLDIIDEAIAVGTVEAAKSDLDMKSIQETIDVYRSYVNFYPNDRWVPLLDDKGLPLIEVPFSKLIYQSPDAVMDKGEGIQVILIGKIDIILAPMPPEELEPIVVDHKSYDRFWTFSSLSNQYRAYSSATGLKRVGRNTFGFQKEGNVNKFKRDLHSFTQTELDEWTQWAIFKVLDTDMHNEMGTYPPNFTSCDKFGGCRFRKVCSNPPEHRESVINMNFMEGQYVDIYKKEGSSEMILKSETLEVEEEGESSDGNE